MRIIPIILALLTLTIFSFSTIFAQPSIKSEAERSHLIQIPSEVISSKTEALPAKVEIEIKPSYEARRLEGCKDLCGDGVCEEVVCMAIGCPCPETPENCPQDCKAAASVETREAIPVITLPTEAKLVVDVAKEEPISVNNKAIKFTVMNTTVLPKISVEVETKTSPATKVEIYVDKENKTIRIEHENISAVTREALKVEEKTIRIETPTRVIEVNVLPSVATRLAISRIPQEIKTTELKVIEERPVYEIEGVRSGKLFWLIPVNFSVHTYVDAQAESIVRVEKPWWSFLVS